MKRQYVHLSVKQEDAYEVGLRRDKNPVILKISALKAHNQGKVLQGREPVSYEEDFKKTSYSCLMLQVVVIESF